MLLATPGGHAIDTMLQSIPETHVAHSLKLLNSGRAYDAVHNLRWICIS